MQPTYIFQLHILQKMFKTLRQCTRAPTLPKSPKSETIDNIERLNALDLNLFPMYGDIKIAPVRDSNKSDEIINSKEDNGKNRKANSKISLEDIEELYMDIKEELPKMQNEFRSLTKLNNNQNREVLNVDSESLDGLKKCTENLKIINQVSSMDLKILLAINIIIFPLINNIIIVKA